MLLLIFVIILNLVFWWLPFFRICLPLPKNGLRVNVMSNKAINFLGQGPGFPPESARMAVLPGLAGRQHTRLDPGDSDD